MKEYLRTKLTIDAKDQKWSIILYDVTYSEGVFGTIEGNIIRENDKKIFEITQSELNDGLQGKGLGKFFYSKMISECLNFCDEVRSSTSLNSFSKNTWRSLVREYYNVIAVPSGRTKEPIAVS